MGKKGKKAQAGKPKKLTPKDVGKRLDVLVKKLGEELKGADLFAPLPPPTEDCAICFVPLPFLLCDKFYQACCGNLICKACGIEKEESINKQNEEKNAGKKLASTCPFCREREPASGGSGYVSQIQARCLKNDHIALMAMGDEYRWGRNGTTKDDLKALDCFIRAVELGSGAACAKIASCYDQGWGVAVDKKRVVLFGKIGALRGDVVARHNVGCSEYYDFGNYEIAIHHWKIAAEAGLQESLNELREIYNTDGKKPGKECMSKDYLDSTYRACHGAQMDVKSEEREKHCTKDSRDRFFI